MRLIHRRRAPVLDYSGAQPPPDALSAVLRRGPVRLFGRGRGRLQAGRRRTVEARRHALDRRRRQRHHRPALLPAQWPLRRLLGATSRQSRLTVLTNLTCTLPDAARLDGRERGPPGAGATGAGGARRPRRAPGLHAGRAVRPGLDAAEPPPGASRAGPRRRPPLSPDALRVRARARRAPLRALRAPAGAAGRRCRAEAPVAAPGAPFALTPLRPVRPADRPGEVAWVSPLPSSTARSSAVSARTSQAPHEHPSSCCVRHAAASAARSLRRRPSPRPRSSSRPLRSSLPAPSPTAPGDCPLSAIPERPRRFGCRSARSGRRSAGAEASMNPRCRAVIDCARPAAHDVFVHAAAQ